jgi:hypothetical protein
MRERSHTVAHTANQVLQYMTKKQKIWNLQKTRLRTSKGMVRFATRVLDQDPAIDPELFLLNRIRIRPFDDETLQIRPLFP